MKGKFTCVEDRYAEKAACVESQLNRIHGDWPHLVDSGLKEKISSMFCKATSSSALQCITCASCAEFVWASLSYTISLNSFNMEILQRPEKRDAVEQTHHNVENTEGCDTHIHLDYLDPDCTAPAFLYNGDPLLHDLLLEPLGVL
jgi:hypothetical protein